MQQQHTKPIYIHAIGTAVPPKSYTQTFALDFLSKLQGTTATKRQFLQKVYANTGIDKRHTVISDYGKDPSEHTFYPQNSALQPEPETWYRNDVFVEEANALSVQAAQSTLEQLPRLNRKRITHVITVSCTGFSVPGFDIHLVKTLGLSPTVDRFHIGFMGCYAAFPAMKMARDICLAHSEAIVLIAGVELCSLHFQQTFSPETVIANAIFADGAAAALISSSPDIGDGPALAMETFVSYLLDNSEKEMAWRIGKHGFDMRLSLYVPALIESNIAAVLNALLDRAGAKFDDIAAFAVHPGGRAILDKVSAALDLPDGALHISYDVLKEFGNMSSVTIFFVLARLLESSEPGRIFAAAFGPGLTVESGLLTKVHTP